MANNYIVKYLQVFLVVWSCLFSSIAGAYDSRDHSVGDFGLGWELGLESMEVSTQGIIGGNWSQIRLRGLTLIGTSYRLSPANNAKVIVKLPGGEVETFTPVVEGGASLFL